jgi:hypothetical protein
MNNTKPKVRKQLAILKWKIQADYCQFTDVERTCHEKRAYRIKLAKVYGYEIAAIYRFTSDSVINHYKKHSITPDNE